VRPDGKKADNYLWSDDLPGFGVKASAGGSRTFIVQYRISAKKDKKQYGKTQRVTLGQYGSITLEQARKAAENALAKVRLAKGDKDKADPAEEVRKVKKAVVERRVAGTLKDAIEAFLDTHEVPKGAPSNYWREKRSRLLRCLEGLLKRPIGELGKAEIKRTVKAVEANSQSVAQLLFGDLRQVLGYAAEMEHIAANPMEDLRAPEGLKARDRVLTEAEIKALWQASGQVSWPWKAIFRLLLLTGQRRSEVSGMRWIEVDLDASLWTLPSERAKNDEEHAIHLTPMAVQILDRVAIQAIKEKLGYKESDWVFGKSGHSGASGYSKAKCALDAEMQKILGDKFQAWCIHDIRRTVASQLEEMGVAVNVTEALLYHKQGSKSGVARIYQRAKHRDAIKRALEAWERRLIEIVSGDNSAVSNNVVQLRRGAI
jgi:integrase